MFKIEIDSDLRVLLLFCYYPLLWGFLSFLQPSPIGCSFHCSINPSPTRNSLIVYFHFYLSYITRYWVSLFYKCSPDPYQEAASSLEISSAIQAIILKHQLGSCTTTHIHVFDTDSGETNQNMYAAVYFKLSEHVQETCMQCQNQDMSNEITKLTI